MPSEAYIVEVFSSIQGEGLTCGERQIFIRFAGCNLRCAYCDTDYARENPKYYTVERGGTGGPRPYRPVPGGSAVEGKYRMPPPMKKEPNPVSAARLVEIVRALNVPEGIHHSVALTGGEPLLQNEFLREFLPANRANNIRSQLETNGTLPERLEQIIDLVDSVSMDIKIKSSAGEEGLWETNRRFLRIAHRKPVWVKVVVSAETTTEEITRAASVVASVHPGIPMIIQPVTPNEKVHACPGSILLSLHETARRYLHTVRVIPQTHKTLGLR